MNESEKSRFLEVVCSRCGNKQMVFGKATTRIKCNKCNKLLVKVTGGKSRIRAIIKNIFR